MCSLQTQVEIVLGNNYFFLLMPVLLCKITLRYESTAEPRGARGVKDMGESMTAEAATQGSQRRNKVAVAEPA